MKITYCVRYGTRGCNYGSWAYATKGERSKHVFDNVNSCTMYAAPKTERKHFDTKREAFQAILDSVGAALNEFYIVKVTTRMRKKPPASRKADYDVMVALSRVGYTAGYAYYRRQIEERIKAFEKEFGKCAS